MIGANGAFVSLVIPVPIYHHIGEPESELFVSPSRLRAQMAWLRENGYESIIPSELLGALDGKASLPERPVMITIDDGYYSDIVFRDVLEEFGFRGTYFWPNISELSPSEMAEIAGSGEIGGHTVSHPDLATLSATEQAKEIGENRTWLEQITGQGLVSFAYPFGSFGEDTGKIVEQAGFSLGFAAFVPPVKLGEIDRWHVPRQMVEGGISMSEFAALFDGETT
jgi:peptidoglycan/xylan/chitin deacetylase (PgdA/CDA1 family)